MIYYTTHIKDTIGNNYLGIKIDPTVVKPFLDKMKSELSEKDYELYTSLKNDRDNGEFHITVINVIDYNHLIKELGMDKFTESLQKVFEYPIDDLKMMGLGTAHKKDNRAYFIVCESEKLDAIRNRYNLKEHDFHITIGFKYKDVFGVRKNKVLDQRSEFLQVVADKYEEYKNWNFIKLIDNFDLEQNEQIDVIEIDETTLKIRYKGLYLVIALIEDKLRVACEYTVDDEKTKMSQTEINKYIEKNKNYDI